MNRVGASLAELVVALALLGIGIVGVASLTGTAARALIRARALDDTYRVLRSFVDSAGPGGEAESGQQVLPSGVLRWHVPAVPGSPAWARFEHVALPEEVEVGFVVPGVP